MINFILIGCNGTYDGSLFCEQKTDGFHDDAIVYSSIGSTQYEPNLHSVN